jgi:DNA-binding beta-propeller fold protein YncE
VYIVLAASIAVLDGTTNAAISTIPINFSPRAIAVNPVTNRIYVTHSDGPGLAVIDGATNAVVTDISAVGGILDVAVNPTTNRVYAPAVGGGLAIINGATNTIATTLGLEGTIPVGIGVNTTTNRVYTSDVLGARIFVIDDSPAVPTSTPTATSVQATPTPTRTSTPTASPTAPTPTPTVPSGGLCGKGLGITSGSGGVFLTWQAGFGQTGYSVLRAAPNGGAFLPPNGLGPNETSFFDSTAPPGLDCYALVLAGTNPQRYSDAICAVMGFHSPSGSPEAFTLRLNQSAFASLTWNPPPGGIPDGYLLVPLGGDAQILPGTATSASQLPTTSAVCFVLGALQSGVLTGFTDIACGIPGFSNLNS